MKYPITFSSLSESQSGMDKSWNVRCGELQTRLSIPTEFEGPGGGLSPEDLFNQALSNCFLATFKVYAEMSKLSYESISISSDLIVDLDDSKKPIMKSLLAKVTLRKPSDPEKALFLAKKAARSGFILNSVKTQCQFDFLLL